MDFIQETEVRILYGTPTPAGVGIDPERMRIEQEVRRSAAEKGNAQRWDAVLSPANQSFTGRHFEESTEAAGRHLRNGVTKHDELVMVKYSMEEFLEFEALSRTPVGFDGANVRAQKWN